MRAFDEVARRRACVFALAWGLAACAPPPALQFFASPPDGFAVLRSVQTNLFLYRVAPTDSVSVQGVDMALDILAQADSAGRMEVATTIRGALAALPRAAATRTFRPGAHDRAVARRMGRGAFADQLDLMRSDLVVFHTVAVDTVEVRQPGVGEGAAVTWTWITLRLEGTSYLDPAAGRDPAGED